jgi:hypothetical protein
MGNSCFFSQSWSADGKRLKTLALRGTPPLRKTTRTGDMRIPRWVYPHLWPVQTTVRAAGESVKILGQFDVNHCLNYQLRMLKRSGLPPIPAPDRCHFRGVRLNSIYLFGSETFELANGDLKLGLFVPAYDPTTSLSVVRIPPRVVPSSDLTRCMPDCAGTQYPSRPTSADQGESARLVRFVSGTALDPFISTDWRRDQPARYSIERRQVP